MKAYSTYFKVIFLLIISGYSFGQQGHFTQFFNAPIYTNPAEAGAENNIRVGLNYRRQWPSISSGYTSKAINADMLIGKFGYGIIVSSNDAGQASLNRTNALFNLAHHLNLNSKNRISIGIQVGLSQYAINTSELQFDSQYAKGSGFNSATASGENFNSQSSTFFASGIGLTYRNRSKWNPSLSFSIKNLIEPRINFVQLGGESSQRQMNLFGEINRKISTKLSLIPYFYFGMQKEASYLQSGLRLGYELASKEQLQFGLGILKKDALLAYVGVPFKNIRIGFSYDINTSKLTPASNGIGAWEFSLSFRFSQTKKLNNDDLAPLKSVINVVPKRNVEMLALSINREIAISSISLSKEVIDELIENKSKASIPIEYKSINPEKLVNHYFVYFDSDMSIIKEEYRQQLNQLITNLKGMPDYLLLVHGHTDSDGDGLYNLYLGEARSKQIMSYLIENGVDISKIQTFTYGKTSPVVDNSSEAKKAKNRRAEILIIKK